MTVSKKRVPKSAVGIYPELTVRPQGDRTTKIHNKIKYPWYLLSQVSRSQESPASAVLPLKYCIWYWETRTRTVRSGNLMGILHEEELRKRGGKEGKQAAI